MKTTEFLRESAEKYEYDDEVGMVKNNLHTMVRVSVDLAKHLKENEDIPEWCQEKIAVAKSMIVTVMDYITSQHEMGHQPEVPGFDARDAERMFTESLAESEGATMSSGIAVSMSQEGRMPTEMIARQKTYTNQMTKGGAVKIKAAK